MHGEESRQSRTRDYGTSKHQPDDGGTENGNAARDGCSNTESPIGILIKAQHLPAECHTQRHQQQKNADNPGKLARKLVGSKKKNIDNLKKKKKTKQKKKHPPPSFPPSKNPPRERRHGSGPADCSMLQLP